MIDTLMGLRLQLPSINMKLLITLSLIVTGVLVGTCSAVAFERRAPSCFFGIPRYVFASAAESCTSGGSSLTLFATSLVIVVEVRRKVTQKIERMTITKRRSRSQRKRTARSLSQ